MATHASILAWKIPCIEDPGRLESTGLQKNWTELNDTTAIIAGYVATLELFWKHIRNIDHVLPTFIRAKQPAYTICKNIQICKHSIYSIKKNYCCIIDSVLRSDLLVSQALVSWIKLQCWNMSPKTLSLLFSKPGYIIPIL